MSKPVSVHRVASERRFWIRSLLAGLAAAGALLLLPSLAFALFKKFSFPLAVSLPVSEGMR